MSPTNAKDFPLISNDSPTEFRNVKVNRESNLALFHFLNIKEMNISGSPFKVMNKFGGGVRLLQDEGIVH